MKTVKEVLETGSREEIEKMLKVWRKLYGKGMKERCRQSSIPTIKAVLSDEEVISILDKHHDLLWSDKKFFSWRAPHKRIIGITEGLIIGWQNEGWVGNLALAGKRDFEFEECGDESCRSFICKTPSTHRLGI